MSKLTSTSISSLVLSSVSEDHGGNYTCRVVNNYGSLEKTVVLEVVQTGQGQQVHSFGGNVHLELYGINFICH